MSDKLIDILSDSKEVGSSIPSVGIKKEDAVPVKTYEVYEDVEVVDPSVSSGSITDVVMKSIEMDDPIIRNRIVKLKEIIEDSYFEIAGLLYIIYNKRLFYKWGYHSFEEYVNEELSFGRRKADYLRDIWYYFGVEVGDSVVLHKVAGLGWTKVKELVGVVTPKNVDDWVELGGRLNTIQLKNEVRIYKARRKIGEGSSSGSGSTPISVEEMETHEPTFRMNFMLYEEQFRNIQDALEKAGELGKSSVKSNQLSLMALSFLSSIGFKGSSSKRKEYISKYFKTIADNMDVDLVVVDRKTNKILLGEELIGDDEPNIEEIDIEE